MSPDRISSLTELKNMLRELPGPGDAAAAAVADRQTHLTKPPGSLGRLERLVAWLATWQARPIPRLDKVDILVFAGNHGVAARNVSAYPTTVTAQMVANFAAGGAAINQIAAIANAELSVVPLDLDHPTADFTGAAAMDDSEYVAAVSVGYQAVPPDADLVCLGDMGIGNTTAAAALTAALLGGDGRRWAGRGTGLDNEGVVRKADVIDAALAHHAGSLAEPLSAAARLGGRELAAIFGAALAARRRRIPVLLDGFVSTAAALPLERVVPGGLDHTLVAHRSAEAGHDALIKALGKTPILDLEMRLGEASGAAVAIPILRAAVACHAGMATFEEARVDDGS